MLSKITMALVITVVSLAILSCGLLFFNSYQQAKNCIGEWQTGEHADVQFCYSIQAQVQHTSQTDH